MCMRRIVDIVTRGIYVLSGGFYLLLGVVVLLLGTASCTLTGLMVLVFNGLGGLILGWLYWRWGLQHAMLCHFAGGVVIQWLGPRLV